MFTVTINNNDWHVSLRAVRDNNKVRKETFCFITMNNDLVSQGEVHKLNTDPDNHYKANYHAFSKAVKVIADRNIRTVLWTEYWKRTKVSKIL